jgi:hypothetical protein
MNRMEIENRKCEMQSLASMLIIEGVVLTERMYLLRKRGRLEQLFINNHFMRNLNNRMS